MGPHEEFLELCAVSISGDLTEEEQKKLRGHLTGCPECRQTLREFVAAAEIAVPLLASNLSAGTFEESLVIKKEVASPLSLSGSDSALPAKELVPSTGDEERGFAFAKRKSYRRTKVNGNGVWMPFAACILLSVALGIYAYRVGEGHDSEVSHVSSREGDTQIEALEQQINDAGYESAILRTQLAGRDQLIDDLHRRAKQQVKSLNELKSTQAYLEHSLQTDAAEKQQIADERASLAQKFDEAQASMQKIQSDLDSAKQQRAQDVILEAQIKDLSNQLREQGKTVAKQDELLSHDRNIRELMGARDLYVVDVYDVSRDGTTQKSTGRLFYTKDKSLVFYAYDLDQEPGARTASTFQAWGRRGPNKEQTLNLGIFYQDNAAKKRWVLKFDDPKAIEEIDAVFVTVEPKGGSQKPSGKPLLSAYLQLSSNHP